MAKKLLRGKHRVIAGVCSGIAEYLGIDVSLIRIIWVVLTAFTIVVPGILIYFICWLLIPNARQQRF